MSKTIKLITLRGPAPQFDVSKGEEGLPQKILVLEWGNNATTKGPVICNETTMRELMAYNAAQNWDRPYFDYDHNTIPESPTYQGEPCDIAGHADRLELTAGVGIHYIMPALKNWTESGRKNIPAGNYPDLSPVVAVNEKNEVIGLHSVAFCRHGATPGLVFLSALPAVQHTSSPATHPSKKASSMKPEDFQKALAKALGLDDTASAEDILAALTAKLTAADAKADDATATKALSAQLTKMEGLLTKQTETITAQGEQLKLLSSGVETNERADILKAAAREGKQVPSVAAKTMNVTDLRLLCAELPSTVPMDKRTPDASTLLLSSTTPAINSELAAIDALTGVSDADVKKYLHKN